MKAVLFTHIDLDGYGSRIMVQKWLPDIMVKHVDYGFDTLPENRKLMAEADLIIFTDISVSRETAELLEQTRKNGKKILLLDHHQSAYDNLHDLGYEWIHIDQSKSGALLAYEWFRGLNPVALRVMKILRSTLVITTCGSISTLSPRCCSSYGLVTLITSLRDSLRILK